MSTTGADWQAVATQAFELGESPFWHPRERTLYGVDIAGRQILRAKPVTGAVQTWDMPSEPGCIAPAASGGWVIALRHGIFRAHEWGGALQRIATLNYDPTQMRANDGKCDALGRLWIGTIDETKVARNAALYSLDCRGGNPLIERKTDPGSLPATTGNGLAWSPDDTTLYWADTPSHTVYAWNFGVTTGAITAQRRFAHFPTKPAGWQYTAADDNGGYRGRPDGAAVDAQGHYFVAMYEGRRLCKFAPDGTLVAEIATPAQCPTMPCFGGDDLQTLFITSARHGRSAQELHDLPLSGCLFSMRVEVPGLPVNFFAD